MKANDRKSIDLFRPVPFYFINTTASGTLSRSAVFSEVEKLKAYGFGGCIVFNKPPDGFSKEKYMGDEWFEVVEHFAEAGRKLKLQIWINDDFDFPPGDAGGRIERIDPTLKQRRLAQYGTGRVETEEVGWGFPAFEEPESSRLFIELVYERYKKRLGHYFGNGIIGFFSDADGRRVNPRTREKLKGRKYYPWSRDFAQLFIEEYGYSIEPHLNDIVNDCGTRSCHDYWKLSGKLYAQWFLNNYEWCKANGLKYSFHSSDTGPFARESCFRSSIFSEGSFLYQAQCCDYPGTDHELLALDGGTHFDQRYYIPKALWGGPAEFVRSSEFNQTKLDVRAKYTASAALLYNKDRALCEAFAATNWGATPGDLRRIAAWQIMQGINFFVPHAVHHRLHGITKYFAPPEFQTGCLNSALRQFNDFLAEMCMIAASGAPVVLVAVLDPTPNVWLRQTDSSEFFSLCDHLNRMPYGYAIADEEFLLKNPKRFKVLIIPNVPVNMELHRIFTDTGGVILRHNEIDRLPELLGNEVEFDGTGELHYMRRKLDDGTEFLLAANIWSENRVIGTIHFLDKSYSLELFPGEIAILGSRFERFRMPRCEKRIINLPEEFNVSWESDNIVPLFRWEDVNGAAMPLGASAETRLFRWRNGETIPVPELLVPRTILDREARFFIDGVALDNGREVKVFADHYLKFMLNDAGNRGEHVLELRCTGEALPGENPIFLSGNFDVTVSCSKDYQLLHMEYYSMKLYIPLQAKIILSKRSGVLLANSSWCEQGSPFYSGAATYSTEIYIGELITDALLVLPNVGAVCSVIINDHEIGECIWQPYQFALGTLPKGKQRLKIRVRNTQANMLEGYLAPSGIIRTPYIMS